MHHCHYHQRWSHCSQRHQEAQLPPDWFVDSVFSSQICYYFTLYYIFPFDSWRILIRHLVGHYDPVQIFSPTRKKGPNSPRARPGDVAYMGTTSPRLNDIRLHHGVIVSSSPRELRQQSSLGPGSYFTADDVSLVGDGSTSGLLKKSHNRRVSGGNEQGMFTKISSSAVTLNITVFVPISRDCHFRLLHSLQPRNTQSRWFAQELRWLQSWQQWSQ